LSPPPVRNSPFEIPSPFFGTPAFAQPWNRNRIRFFKADITGAETITTVAGTGTAGFSGDEGPAMGAQLSDPLSIAADVAGNLFIADKDNHRIRKVAAGTGITTTVAGTGTGGFSGDGGSATGARINNPTSVAVDESGNLFIVDKNNQRIRKIAPAPVPVLTSLFPTNAQAGGPAFTLTLNGSDFVAASVVK
jgi:hypothetical protein